MIKKNRMTICLKIIGVIYTTIYLIIKFLPIVIVKYELYR